MKVRDKTLLITGAVLSIVLLALFVSAQAYLREGARQAEQKNAQQDIEQLSALLGYQLQMLDSSVADWAHWDETYAFIEDQNESFIQSNLVESTLPELRINLLAFVRPSGQVVAARAYDFKAARSIPVPAAFLAHLTPASPLVRETSLDSQSAGLLQLPEGILLVASRPIVTSAGQGPIRGAVIMGRYMDEDSVALLSRLSHLSVSVAPIGDPTLPPVVQTLSAPGASLPALTQAIDENNIMEYGLLRDIDGQPAAVYEIRRTRTDYQQGRQTLLDLLAALIIASLLVSGLNVLILNHLVFSRISRLRGEMSRVAQSGELSARLDLPGSDELAGLAKSINGMLSGLEHSHRQQLDSEQRYRAVVAQASEGIFLADARSKRILETNAAYQKLVGYSDRELRAMTLYELISLEPSVLDRRIQEALSGSSVFGEHEHHRRDGVAASVEGNLTSISYGGGQVLCLVLRDITERKRAQDVLRRSQDYYRALIDSSLDPIGILNADGVICYISPAIVPVLGLQPQEVIGTSVFDYIHPDELDLLKASFEKTVRSPGHVGHAQLRARGRDGGWRTIQVATRNLLDDPAVVGLVFNFRDITERRAIEQAVRANELRYRTLFEASTDAILLETMDLRVMDCNASACELYGFTKEELCGKPVVELMPPEISHLWPDLVELGVSHGGFFVQSLNRKKDGEIFPCEVSSRMATINGERLAIVFVRDISERRRTEAVQEAIYRIAQSAVESPTLDALYGAIHEIVGSVMPAGNFYIALYDEARDFIDFPYFRDESDPPPAPKRPGRGLTEYVLRTGRSFLCTLEQNEELQRRGEVEIIGAPSLIWLGVPLVVGGRTIGVMAVQHYEDELAYGPREQQMLEFVSLQVAKAIDSKSQMLARARAEEAIRGLYSETQRRADEFAALYATARDLAVEQDVYNLLQTIVDRALKLLDSSMLAVLLYDAQHEEMEMVAAGGFRPPFAGRRPLDGGLVGLVARTRQPLIVNDYSEWEHRLPELERLPVTAEMAVPMVYGGELIGLMLAAQIGIAKPFSENEMRLLSLFAAQAASAVHNTRLYRETRTRAEQLALVYEAGLAVNRVLEPRAQLELLFNGAMQALGAERAEFFRYDPAGDELVVELSIGYPESVQARINSALRFPLQQGGGVVARPALTRSPLNLADVRREPDWLEIDPEVRSGLWVPVEHENQLIGVLGVLSSRPGAFSADDERLLTLFSSQAAVAFENARLFQETRRRADHLAVLNRIANAASQTLDLDELLEAIYRETEALLHPEAFFIALYDPAAQELDYRIRVDQGVRHREDDRKPLSATLLTAQVITGRQPLLIPDLNAERDKYPSPRLWGSMKHARSWMGVPLQIGSTVIGVISLQAYYPNAFGDEDVRLLSTIADQAALAVEKARLFNLVRRELEERTRAEQAEHEQRALAEALRDTASALNRALNLDEMYESIIANVGRVVPHDAVNIMMLEGGVASVVKCQGYAAHGVPDHEIMALTLPVAQVPSIQRTLQIQEPLVIPDTAADPDWVKIAPTHWIASYLVVPIRINGQVIGFINLDSATPRFFNASHAERLKAFADQAAVALEKARLFHETRRRLAELEAVNRISTALRAAQTRGEMLPILLDETLAVMGTDAGQLAFQEPSSGELQAAVSRGWFNLIPPRAPSHAGLSGGVLLTEQPAVVQDYSADPRTGEWLQGRVPAGWGGAMVPIRAAHKVIGVLHVSVSRPRELQRDDVHLLTTIAEIAGNAIHRATLHEETERRMQRLAALQTIDLAIGASLDLRITLDILLDQVIAQLGVDAVDVLLFRPLTQSLELAAGRGFRSSLQPRSPLRIGEGQAGRAALERRIIHIPDLRQDGDGYKTPWVTAEEFVTCYDVPLIAKGQVKGVLEIFNRSRLQTDPEWLNFLQALAGEAAIALADAQLFEDLQRSNLELALAYDATIEGWSRALEMRDQETRGHTRRVVNKTLDLARVMGVAEEELPHMRRGALLHDIGKMAIPDSILFKPGPLTPEEWQVMRQHPTFAHAMLAPITYLRPALDIPLCHHEHWDGKGYPRGLRGEQIPLAARIFTVVDVWDALRSDRPYRAGWMREQVCEYIEHQAGCLFDPRIAASFLRMMQSREYAEEEAF